MANVIDQQYTTNNDAWGLKDVAGHTKLAQQFIPSLIANVVQVILKLQKVNAPSGNLTVDIYTDNAGAPGSVFAASSNTVAASTISASAGGAEATFTVTSTQLFTSVPYWVVLSGTYAIDGTNFIEWREDDTGGYTGHPAMTQNGSNVWSTLASSSFYFKEYYDSTTVVTGGLFPIL